MRQIASLLVAVAVFAVTFLLTSLVSRHRVEVEVGGMTLVSTIPGLVLAACFAALAYKGHSAK